MQHAQFYLDGGSHKDTRAGRLCLLEASIVAAGFAYRGV